VDRSQKSLPWIFAHVSIQRYIAEAYKKGNEKNAISVLVGCNRDHFSGAWENDTTLIRLGVKRDKDGWRWESGVGDLLDSFSARKLVSPNDIFATPQRYANYRGASNVVDDEYQIVFAEGRKFGDGHGRGNQVKTGTSLRERSQIIQGVLNLLDGWLQLSPPLQKDTQNGYSTLALRPYDYMVEERKDNTAQRTSWRTALETSLKSGDQSHLHL